MAKEITCYIKLQAPSGTATPGPPIGPALGQHGLSGPDFCKAFNDRTSGMEQGLPVPVVITVYKDRSFDFEIKSLPASYLIRKLAGIESGSSAPNKDKVGKLSKAQLAEIATMKQKDLNAADLEAAMRTIAGTARSMGVEVSE